MSEECCLNGTAFLLNAFIVSMLHISMAKDAARPHETTETLAPKTLPNQGIVGQGQRW